jgi:tetratricopeptide (TPR) repeat protein
MSKCSVRALVALGLATTSVAAPAEWSRYEAPHFSIYSESPPKTVEVLASRLEKMDAMMHLATGHPDDGDIVKVRIYEVHDNNDVAAALGLDHSGVAGFYTNNSLGPFAVTPRKTDFGQADFTPELVLHHEYAHHFMLQYFPGVYPSWYVEGFAELIGSSTILPDGRVAYGMPAKHRGNEILANWVSLQELLLKPAEKIVYFDTYGQGWALTHFLTFSKTRSPQLRRYLMALSAGKSQSEAAAAFGDLGELNKEARRYVGEGTFEYKAVKVAVNEPVITSRSPIDAGEAALIPETIAFSDDDLSAYRKVGARDKEQRRRTANLARIREKTARFANDPFALHLLAESEAAESHYREAEAAADRLLAIAPNNADGLARKSLSMSQRASTLTGPAKIALAAEARHFAVRANQIDGAAPLPVLAFYESYHQVGAPVPATAIEGLAAIMALRPYNEKVRLMLVDAYASQHRYREAIATITPIANSPHDSPQRSAARDKLSMLKAAAGLATTG